MNLKARVVSASVWILAGYAGNQFIRIVTNLILTRLLFPEAFGMMAVVFAVNTGVTLLTDIGISGGIVIHANDVDESYLSTAWTIQVVRGCLITVCMFAAAHPLAMAFSNAQLEPLFRIVALGPAISGFTSTNVALADRRLQARRRVTLELANQIVSVCITAVLAWTLRSTTALAWGSIVAFIITVVTGHIFMPGPRSRFTWDREKASAIVSVGRLALLTSALTFAAGEGSRLFSATMVDSRALGLISLAAGLATMPWQAISRVSQRVLMPAYAELTRTGDLTRLRKALLKARAVQIVPSWCANVLMIVLADKIFGVLYDPRYSHAAHILQIQSAGMLVGAVSASYEGVLWGMRRLSLSLAFQIAQSVFIWLGLGLGFLWGGPMGMVIGSAIASWALYPVSYLIFKRLGLANLMFDMAIIVPSMICTALLIWLAPPVMSI